LAILISKFQDFQQPEMMQLSQRLETQWLQLRNAIAMERQKRILRGDFTPVTAVGGSLNVFGHFDNNTSLPMVLEYPIPNTPNTKDKWSFSAGSGNGGRDQYIFKSSLGDVIFEVVNGKFECDIALTSNTK